VGVEKKKNSYDGTAVRAPLNKRVRVVKNLKGSVSLGKHPRKKQ